MEVQCLIQRRDLTRDALMKHGGESLLKDEYVTAHIFRISKNKVSTALPQTEEEIEV